MARYAKSHGVAEHKTKGGRVVAELTPDLQWIATIEGAREDLREPMARSHEELLGALTHAVLIREGGGIGPQFGTRQGHLLEAVTRELGWDVLQWPESHGLSEEVEF